ncbi:MAG TPA: SPOR domain-containing protein [Beijerinckiaceae bacterium]|nr:SPOR domain-containing protein [Beijerinckiaceae bacterium]
MSESAARVRAPIDLEEFERRLRMPIAAASNQEDPLAELARLVSGGDRVNAATGLPKANFRPVLAAARHSVEPSVAAFDPGPLRGALPEAEEEHGSYSEEPANSYDDESSFDVDEMAEERPRRSGRAVLMTGGALALVLVGIAATFAMRGHASASGDAPTIKAAAGPTKVQPPPSDNVDVADRNATLLDRSNGDHVAASKVVNAQEQPVDLQTVNLRQPTARPASVGAAPVQAAPSRDSAASANPFPTPIRVHTVSVRPDGTIISDNPVPSRPTRSDAAAPAIPPAPAPLAVAASNSAAMTGVAMPTALPPAPRAPQATPKSTARVVTTPKAPVPAGSIAPSVPASSIATTRPIQPPPMKPTRVATAEPGDGAKPATGAGAYAVQLAAPASQQEAKETVSRFEKKYSSELQGHHLSVVQADSNGRTVFRVRVVGLAADDANVLCSKLKMSGGACYVAHD